MTGGPRTIALIGASRIQSGISPANLRRRLPDYQVVQLGEYAGGSPIGVLRAIASDDRFDGIVICDILAPFLLRDRWDDQRSNYEYPATMRDRLESFESARIESMLAINNQETGIVAVLERFATHGRAPLPNYVRMRLDRSLELDFTLLPDLDEFRIEKVAGFRRRYKRAEQPQPHELDDEFREVDTFVRRIQARGGQVVFLRMPSSGGRLELEETYHPKVGSQSAARNGQYLAIALTRGLAL